MILVHIITNDKEKAREITNFLVAERLILDGITTKVEKTFRTPDGDIGSEKQFLVRGKTKALLFNTIDQRLRKKYGDDLPTLYSVPIVQMDWRQSSELIEKTEKV
jgi:uncharacterized protein involved in tolerance to divalent cations